MSCLTRAQQEGKPLLLMAKSQESGSPFQGEGLQAPPASAWQELSPPQALHRWVLHTKTPLQAALA